MLEPTQLVQQSSFYGYTSMLPSRYTQAVMAGESAAGFFVSSNRILTKMLLDDQKVNTIIFFGMSVAIIALCFGLHQIVKRTDFVQFYITLCRESRKIVLEPTEDVGLMDPLDQNDGVTKSQYGVLKLQQSPLATDSATSSSDNNLGVGAFSFCNPVYEPTGTGVGGGAAAAAAGGGTTTYKVEDVVVRMRSTYTHNNSGKAWGGMKRGLMARWEVAKTIWPFMLSIGLAYFVTLCLYPGIESEIVSCRFGSWMPVILMAIFNAADLVGKVLASVPYDWSRSQLIVFAWVRTMLIPLLLLCTTPRGNPLISGEGYPMLFSLILGVTNGLVGSVPMIQAPSRVSEEHRELTGNIMTLSYNVGLTAGSLVAYLLDAIIGPPLPGNGCRPPVHLSQPVLKWGLTTSTASALNVTGATAATTLATTLLGGGTTEAAAAVTGSLAPAALATTVAALVSQVADFTTTESVVTMFSNFSGNSSVTGAL